MMSTIIDWKQFTSSSLPQYLQLSIASFTITHHGILKTARTSHAHAVRREPSPIQHLIHTIRHQRARPRQCRGTSQGADRETFESSHDEHEFDNCQRISQCGQRQATARIHLIRGWKFCAQGFKAGEYTPYGWRDTRCGARERCKCRFGGRRDGSRGD